VECQPRERRQCALLVVHVVHRVEVLISPLDLVQRPMHPVHTKFHAGHVQHKLRRVRKVTHVANPRVRARPSVEDAVLGRRRQERIEGHRLQRNPHLQFDRLEGRDLARLVEF